MAETKYSIYTKNAESGDFSHLESITAEEFDNDQSRLQKRFQELKGDDQYGGIVVLKVSEDDGKEHEEALKALQAQKSKEPITPIAVLYSSLPGPIDVSELKQRLNGTYKSPTQIAEENPALKDAPPFKEPGAMTSGQQ